MLNNHINNLVYRHFHCLVTLLRMSLDVLLQDFVSMSLKTKVEHIYELVQHMWLEFPTLHVIFT